MKPNNIFVGLLLGCFCSVFFPTTITFAAAAVPSGNFDSADCNQFTGWTCDPTAPATPLIVYFYDGPWAQNKTEIAKATADIIREQAVANICGGNASHGFQIAVPAAVKDGVGHQIYAYAFSTDYFTTKTLGPLSISCVTPSLVGSVTNIACDSVTGWACDRGNAQPTWVQVFNGPYSAGNTDYTYGLANQSLGSGPAGSCKDGSDSHWFSIAVPAKWKDGQTHSIFSYTTSNNGNASLSLANSPSNLQCSACIPNCAGKTCGSDGCGGLCGSGYCGICQFAPTSCGDGICNKGESLANCPQDCNAFSHEPPDNVAVLPTGDYTIGTYVMPALHDHCSPLPSASLKDVWTTSWGGSGGLGVMNATPAMPGADQPRKPLIGYYDDTNQAAVDWMIKMGLEHGVSLYVYDWYWYNGQKFLHESLENTFLKSKYISEYPDKLKFAVMFTDFYPFEYTYADAKTDLLNMMDYMIKNYFTRLQYFKIDNKPVLFIYDQGLLSRNLGTKQAADLFSQWKQMVKNAGYSDLLLISEAASLTPVHGCGDASLGINGNTYYAWITPSQTDSSGLKYDTYDNFIQTYKNEWNALSACPGVSYYFPTISPGWDNTPVDGNGVNGSLFTYSTPDKYKIMAQAAKDFVDQKNYNPKIIINEAWDEWGEGAVLAPTVKWDFGYLDALANVYGQNYSSKVADCMPNCDDKTCGDNSCGGTCGTCGGGQLCAGGTCTTSVSACVSKTCSGLGYVCGVVPDGCGGMLSCGACASGSACNNSGHCIASSSLGAGGGGGITNPPVISMPVVKMTRPEIMAKIAEIKKLLIQLIRQLIIELQKQP